MGSYIDLTGHKYNRLTCLKKIGKKGSQTLWLCICDCGREHVATAGHLRSNHTTRCKQCGIESRRTHFRSNTNLYRRWIGIKTRCNNEKNCRYSSYGARGIKVCEEWENSFEAFEEWSLKNGYSKELTIDRIDNNKGYSPENCRWITNKEQQNNRNDNFIVEYRGEKKTITEWSEQLGVCTETLGHRVKKWGVEKAFNTPVRKTRKNTIYHHKGKEYKIKDIYTAVGICQSTFYNWLQKGMTVEQILEKGVK